MRRPAASAWRLLIVTAILVLCTGIGTAWAHAFETPTEVTLPAAGSVDDEPAVDAGPAPPAPPAESAPPEVLGAAATVIRRYEQDDFRLVYSGAWTGNLPATLASRGSFRYAYTGQASVTLEFTGTSMAWIGQMHPGYGEAKVTLDGSASFTVDLYSETTQWNTKLWESGPLEAGSHSVVIEWTGTKNPSATNSLVGIDAFDIAGTLQQAPAAPRYEQDDARLWYQGLWNDRNTVLASGGRITFARTPADSVTVTFNGTVFRWIGRTGPDGGMARVIVDGGEPATVDLYAPGTAWKQIVWQAESLSAGAHTVKIEPTGTNHPDSTDTVVILDAVDLDGTLVLTPQPAVEGLLVFDGNSLTTGVGAAVGDDYPAQLLESLVPGSWRGHDVAVGGQSTTEMLADAATQVDPLYSAGYPRNVVVCLTGTIDRLADGNAARQATLQSYCQGRRAAGFKVIVVTLPSYTLEDYPGATRAEFNDWIRANYRSFADGLADVGADGRIGSQGAFADPTYIPDGMHLNTAGYAVIAEIVKRALGRLPITLRGSDRYDTALKISRAAFSGPLPAGSGLVLAPGETFPEALCGAPLAAAWGGTVLLTPSVGLNNGVCAEMQRLAPAQVFCVGLSDTVAAAVQTALPGATVITIRGDGGSAYDLSRRIALALADKVGDMSGATAIITRGMLFADAISVSPLACAQKWPVLLDDNIYGSLNDSAAATLADLGITQVLKVGTYVALPPGVTYANASGADRYHTNRNVAEWAVANAGLSFANLGMATGDKFPDALAAGPYLAADGGILLLSPLLGPLPPTISAVISANATAVQNLTFFAMIEPVVSQVTALLPQGGVRPDE